MNERVHSPVRRPPHRRRHIGQIAIVRRRKLGDLVEEALRQLDDLRLARIRRAARRDRQSIQPPIPELVRA